MKLSGIYPDRELQSIGRLLTEFLTGLTWVQIRLNQEKEFTMDEQNRINSLLDRMIKHEPIQYVLGETEFYGMKLKVRPGVLIPRGETEELVDWIIKAQGPRLRDQGSRLKAQGSRLKAQGSRLKAQREKGLSILDIGCGSGAIALALAKNLPDAEVVAADISEEALQLTRENAVLNGLGDETHNYASLRTLHLDILAKESFSVIPANAGTSPLYSDLFDIVVSNPPYIPLSEKTSMNHHVIDFEPEMALFVPDNDPLLYYRAIADFAGTHLNPGGQVFVEIHDRLGRETTEVFGKWFSIVELRKDIHGKDRMIRAYHG